MSVKVGDKAPDFSLLSNKVEKVSLSDFRGKNVVLLFFPLANTGVCTKEMCTFRDELKSYENLNAQVLGISVDSPFALQMWAEKNNYNFPLLSDFNNWFSPGIRFRDRGIVASLLCCSPAGSLPGTDVRPLVTLVLVGA